MAVSSLWSIGRAALVVGAVIVGTAAVAGSLFIGGDTWSANVFFFGPALLGALVALVAAGRAQLLGMAAAVFVALGVVGLIALGANGRAEGGALVVFWIIVTEIAGLYGAVGVWRLGRYVKGRRCREQGYDVAAS